MAGRHTFTALYEVDHHWDFEEGTGPSVADVAGGKTGTISGAAWDSSAAVGDWCLDFDGSNDVVTVADDAAWDLGTADMAICCMVNGTNWEASELDRFIGEGPGISGTGPTLMGWSLNLKKSVNELWFSRYDGASTHAKVSWTPSTGVWYHVAVTRSGTDVKLYADGVQLGATQTISAALAYDRADSIGLTMGKMAAGAGPTDYYSDFDLDDVRLYKGRILNVIELATLSNYIGDQ